jgi:rhodanese-related sulfurtransferase
MSVKRVSPEEALSLVEKDGWVYVDVRSVPEFEGGHPKGAYNVPLAHLGPAGMSPNHEFLRVMEKTFSKDSKLVVGCQSGGRSLQAATILLSAGFPNVVDQRAGYRGGIGPSGRPEPGWGPKGLPSSTVADEGRSWEQLKGGPR